jgi:DNA-binding response OmpR family regulator
MATILLIDDSVAFAQVLKEALETNDHQVITAYSGTEAIRLLEEIGAHRTLDLHLVLCDLGLHDMSGIDVLAYLRQHTMLRGVQFIMASGSPDGKMQSLAAGADHFLHKPFSVIDLLTLIAPR